MPVIRTQQTIKQLANGDIVAVLCTDPGTLHDIPTWCRMYGHEVLLVDEQAEQICFHIKVVKPEEENDNDAANYEPW
jgi:tRNA 2-thiouridine synthesizing protein A